MFAAKMFTVYCVEPNPADSTSNWKEFQKPEKEMGGRGIELSKEDIFPELNDVSRLKWI